MLFLLMMMMIIIMVLLPNWFSVHTFAKSGLLELPLIRRLPSHYNKPLFFGSTPVPSGEDVGYRYAIEDDKIFTTLHARKQNARKHTL